MEIRKTRPEELDVLLKMYENARRFMATHGNASHEAFCQVLFRVIDAT